MTDTSGLCRRPAQRRQRCRCRDSCAADRPRRAHSARLMRPPYARAIDAVAHLDLGLAPQPGGQGFVRSKKGCESRFVMRVAWPVEETVNVTADFLPNLERENRSLARAQERDDRLDLREIVRAQLRLLFERPPQIRASALTRGKDDTDCNGAGGVAFGRLGASA